MVAYLCESTKNHSITYFKRVNVIVCESYLNKAVKYFYKAYDLNIWDTDLLCEILFGFSTLIYNICLMLALP